MFVCLFLADTVNRSVAQTEFLIPVICGFVPVYNKSYRGCTVFVEVIRGGTFSVLGTTVCVSLED